jgi:hypothetical protein
MHNTVHILYYGTVGVQGCTQNSQTSLTWKPKENSKVSVFEFREVFYTGFLKENILYPNMGNCIL